MQNHLTFAGRLQSNAEVLNKVHMNTPLRGAEAGFELFSRVQTKTEHGPGLAAKASTLRNASEGVSDTAAGDVSKHSILFFSSPGGGSGCKPLLKIAFKDS